MWLPCMTLHWTTNSLTLKWLALISPQIITPESNIQVTAIKEMNKEALEIFIKFSLSAP